MRFHTHRWVTVIAVDSAEGGGYTKRYYVMCEECHVRQPEPVLLERGEWWVTA